MIPDYILEKEKKCSRIRKAAQKKSYVICNICGNKYIGIFKI